MGNVIRGLLAIHSAKAAWVLVLLIIGLTGLVIFALRVRADRRRAETYRGASFAGRQQQRREAARLASVQTRKAPITRRERREMARFIASTLKAKQERWAR